MSLKLKTPLQPTGHGRDHRLGALRCSLQLPPAKQPLRGARRSGTVRRTRRVAACAVDRAERGTLSGRLKLGFVRLGNTLGPLKKVLAMMFVVLVYPIGVLFLAVYLDSAISLLGSDSSLFLLSRGVRAAIVAFPFLSFLAWHFFPEIEETLSGGPGHGGQLSNGRGATAKTSSPTGESKARSTTTDSKELPDLDDDALLRRFDKDLDTRNKAKRAAHMQSRPSDVW